MGEGDLRALAAVSSVDCAQPIVIRLSDEERRKCEEVEGERMGVGQVISSSLFGWGLGESGRDE